MSRKLPAAYRALNMNVADKKPSEIARDTLRLLLTRKLVPNPANYRTVYHEVSGTPEVPPFPADPLRHMIQALPLRTPAQQRHRSQLDQAIVRQSWTELQTALIAYTNAAAAPVASAVTPAKTDSGNGDFLEQLARLIENALPALGTDDTRFAEQAKQLVATIRDPASGTATIKSLLGNFTLRLSFAAEDQAEIRAALLKLLKLIIENIGELSRDDQWMKKQIDALMEAAAPPLSLRRLDDVERRIKELMFKQVMAKGRALEAQEEMRRMLATFVERLGQMTESTSAHSQKMEASARLIEGAKSFEDLGLCTALLDIDNFKKLNDSKGHDAGDAALTHLVDVTRESMRPQDTLARYGGEEFVIVMPDTQLEQGIEAMTRLQRALTKRLFLADNEKIVITFSAGVAQLAAGEAPQDAIKRADQAMYLAKRAGKNRVVGA